MEDRLGQGEPGGIGFMDDLGVKDDQGGSAALPDPAR